MANVMVPITAYNLTVYPKSISSNRLASPSFWTDPQITAAFADANRIWKQAQIGFGPIQVVGQDMYLSDGDNDMWADYINQLTPKHGIGVGFVYDFPGPEGGMGGGRIAIVGKKKGAGARDGFLGGVLAHELGHVLLDHTHSADRHNLMYESRSLMSVTRDVLDQEQITMAKAKAIKYSN